MTRFIPYSLSTHHARAQKQFLLPRGSGLADGWTDMQMHDDKGDWEGNRAGAEDHRQIHEPGGRGT